MLYYIFQQLGWVQINLFRYVSFRSVLGACIAFTFSLLIGPALLRLLQRKMSARSFHGKDHDGLTDIHSVKTGTPNMGGILMILSTLAGVLLVCDLSNIYVLGGIYVVVGFGFLGFIDDVMKLYSRKSKGLSKLQKISWQFFMTSIVAILILNYGHYYQLYPESTYVYHSPDTLTFPGLKNILLAVGPWLFLIWAFLVMAGASNGVNLTDGLDGLATGCFLVAIVTYAVITYVVSRVDTTQYLYLLYAPGASELVIFCLTIAGSCLGFLWFNAHPAEVFMGDTGSLFLGAFIGYVALVIKQEVLLILVGGVFVIETGSVILQVFSFRVFGKRLFRIAPIHHMFELQGLKESKITIRFWIVQLILALICLASLKLR